MKLSLPNLGIGIGIGAVIAALFVFNIPTADSGVLVVGGYIKEVSGSTLTITQNLLGEIDVANVGCIDYCGENDIQTQINRDTAMHGCGGVQDGLDVDSCLERIDGSLSGLGVCTYLHLIEGKLYAEHVFLNQKCDTPPRAS